MSIPEWVDCAPLDVKKWLTSVPVLNFIRAERNQLFQMTGRYDGAMSSECKEAFQKQYLAVNGILAALGDLLEGATDDAS